MNRSTGSPSSICNWAAAGAGFTSNEWPHVIMRTDQASAAKMQEVMMMACRRRMLPADLDLEDIPPGVLALVLALLLVLPVLLVLVLVLVLLLVTTMAGLFVLGSFVVACSSVLYVYNKLRGRFGKPE
jgi:hypothetical protein